jgi:mannose-6-phosphate isomerase
LGDGVIVFEVQENSDTTFRLFDWDHIDAKTGKPRPLQIDKALAAIDFKQGAVKPLPAADDARQDLLENTHFRLVRWQKSDEFAVGAPDDPRVLVCAQGTGQVIAGEVKVTMKRGDVVLLPASLGKARFNPGESVILFEIAIPEAA